MQQKEHSQQSNTNKNTFIYQQVHYQKIMNVQNIVWQIFVCMCEHLLLRCMKGD